MRSHQMLSVLMAIGLLSAVHLPNGDAGKAGKGVKGFPKSTPTEAEPWVAGYTLTQWIEFYRTGGDKQKENAARMIAWCCTERRSAEAAKAMVAVLQDEPHRLTACKALAGMNWEGRFAAAALVPWASSKEKSTEVRMAALNALGGIGLTKPGVLEMLIEGVNDSQDPIRRTAGYAIYRIGPDARPLVPALIKALKHPEPVVAESAAIALSGIGEDAREAAPALIEALKYPNWLVRRHVTEALQRLHSNDPAVHKALVAGLKDDNVEVSSGCAWALHFCRDVGPEVIDGFCWALQHGNERARYYAANALSEHGLKSPQTMEPLIGALADKKTRAVAATALGKRRPVTEKTVAALLEAFDKSHYERIPIAQALGEMGPAAESAAGRLKEALKERAAEGSWSYELVYVAVAHALWKITKDRDMIPVLAKLANYSYDHHVTNGACMALAEIGAEAKLAVPNLILALKAPRETWSAAKALAKIGAPEGEKALREMLASPDHDKRVQAAYALWELKRDAHALSELAACATKHPDRFQRRHATKALGHIDSKNDLDRELALRCLVAALEDECPYVQKEAARALARLGPEAAPAVRTLARLLKSDSWSVAHQAAQSLGVIGPAAAKALPELRSAKANRWLHDVVTKAINKIEND